MSTVLVVSHDRVGSRMAGVGIRYYEVACALAEHGLQVTLAAPSGSQLPQSALPALQRLHFETFASLDAADLRTLISQHTHLLAYPDTIWHCRQWLDEANTFVIVDGYDITLLEQLELAALEPGGTDGSYTQVYLERLSYVLRRGDFFVTATERQRDFWLGLLTLAGRVNVQTYQVSPSLRNLVDLLPYGMPSEPPIHTRRVMRGVVPGIGDNDFVVLWGGGAWQWLDPLTLVRAAEIVAQQRRDVKFFFPGVAHPVPEIVGTMPVQQELVTLSEQLGLRNSVVFFGNWVEYEDWQNYLIESDCGVSLHCDHLEARFAARTRVISYLWAGLPMILTEGDELADRMAKLGIAKLVSPQDERAVASAILELAAARSRKLPIPQALRVQYSWVTATQRVAEVCKTQVRSLQSPKAPSSALLLDCKPQKPTPPSREQHLSAQPDICLPLPVTPLASALYPLIRATVLWYVESLVTQQNRLNAHVLAQLAHHRARLDEQQAQLGQHQARLDEQQAQLGQHQARLDEQQAQLGQHQARLDEQQAQLGQHQARLDEQQAQLGQHQARLDEQQAQLGQHQARLDEQQTQLSQQLNRTVHVESRLTEAELLVTDLVEQVVTALLR